MEINVEHWTSVRSLKRPDLSMLRAEGLIQTCAAKGKADSISTPTLPKLVRFDRAYVENYFLQYFYEILVQEFLEGVIEEETGESEEASANVADVLCAAITSFKCYLGKMPIDDLTAKKPLDAYRAFRKASS